MQELYDLIEAKIKASGYPDLIDGCEFYNDICSEVEDQEEGEYVFDFRKSDDVFYHASLTIFEDQFDLHYVDIRVGESVYHVDFDC